MGAGLVCLCPTGLITWCQYKHTQTKVLVSPTQIFFSPREMQIMPRNNNKCEKNTVNFHVSTEISPAIFKFHPARIAWIWVLSGHACAIDKKAAYEEFLDFIKKP